VFNFNTPRILFRTPVHYQLPSHLPRLLLNPKGQPRYVKKCELTQRLINLLAPLDWDSLPMTLGKRRTGHRTIPLCAYIGAYVSAQKLVVTQI